MEKGRGIGKMTNFVAKNTGVHQHLQSLLFPSYIARHDTALLKERRGHMREFWPKPELFD